MNGLNQGSDKSSPNQIRILQLMTILSLITLSLSWIQDYPYKITIATYNRLFQTDKRLSVSDNNIEYIIILRERNLPTAFIFLKKDQILMYL